MNLNDILINNWNCLNEDGNQFITELASKFLPLFNNAESFQSATSLMQDFFKEFSAFEASDIGVDAEITKEVLSEVYDFLFAMTDKHGLTMEDINDAYWKSYHIQHEINT